VSLRNSQTTGLLAVEQLKVPVSEWVLAKYCLDNGVSRLTAKDIKFILGTKYPFSLYYTIRMFIRDGLLTPVKKFSGLYDVNKEAMLRVLQLIPEAIGRRVRGKGPAPQWKEAAEIAEVWLKLRDWALQHSSDETIPPSPPGSPGAAQDLPPGARKYFPIERIPTPNGMYAWAAVLGNRYVLLEGIARMGWGKVYCIPYDFRPGARLCSQRVDTLVKYTSLPYYVWSRQPGNSADSSGGAGAGSVDRGSGEGNGNNSRGGGVKDQGGGVSPASARADPSPSGGRPGADGEGGGTAVKAYNIKAQFKDDGSVVIEGELPELEVPLKGSAIPLIRRVDPLRPPEGQPPLSLVFDNVRYWDGVSVRQLRGLKGVDTVLLLGSGLVYVEPGFQVADKFLYELSKLMDIHIYHSAGKDPRGVVRVEARPRARALKKLGLARVLQLFATYLHRLSMAFTALASAWSSFKYAG